MLSNKDLKRIKELKAENPELEYLFTSLEDDHKMTVSTISHELRNTLSLVISSLQYMENCHNEVSKFKYWPETMIDLAYMKELLVNLSDFNNSQNVKFEKIEIRTFVEHIYQAYLPMIEDNKKTFNFTSCSDYPIIMADKTKLKQALINLIKNAFEAISEEGIVALDLKSFGDFVSISVTDNGCGIDEERLKDIFIPFTTYKNNGTGLGLPIAKSIIESHNGILKVNSKPDLGTAITITLSRNPAPA